MGQQTGDGKGKSLKPNHREFNLMRSLDWGRKRAIVRDFQKCSSLCSLVIKSLLSCVPHTPRQFDTHSGVKLNILTRPKDRHCLQITGNLQEFTQEERHAACGLLLETLSLAYYVSQPLLLWPKLVTPVAIPVTLLSLYTGRQRTCPWIFWKGLQYFLFDIRRTPNHKPYSK